MMTYYTISDAVLKQIQQSLMLCNQVAKGSKLEVVTDSPKYIETDPISESISRPWKYFHFQYYDKEISVIRKNTGLYHLFCVHFVPDKYECLDSKSDIETVRNTYGIFPKISDALIAYIDCIRQFCCLGEVECSIKHYKQLELEIF